MDLDDSTGAPHPLEDPLPNPEPAVPSLPEPDPGVYHHEPGHHTHQHAATSAGPNEETIKTA